MCLITFLATVLLLVLVNGTPGMLYAQYPCQKPNVDHAYMGKPNQIGDGLKLLINDLTLQEFYAKNTIQSQQTYKIQISKIDNVGCFCLRFFIFVFFCFFSFFFLFAIFRVFVCLCFVFFEGFNSIFGGCE